MNKIYYLSVNNKNIGPFSKEDIVSKIANGSLNDESFIYVKGEKNWQLLSSIDFFKNNLDNVNKNIIKRWYVHKNNTNYGPYSINDLLNLIELCQFDIDDYTWSKGLDKWILLRELKELSFEKEIATEISLLEPINNSTLPNKTNKDKSIKHKKIIVLVPEFFLSIVLIYFALLIDKKIYSLYLYIASGFLFLFFIVFNFIIKRKKLL